ncbi:MAG: hypothetical protein E7390_07085 [Ruminococcaceae bacterium]|nr:hypothetical protein [Oscillospiraceae bacterium]
MEKWMQLRPAVPGTGFAMEGYFVWCGSVIKENGIYYLFAARWPEEKGFPGGYLTDSEIVLATTDDLAKPFRFEKVLLTKRDGGYWDSAMQHNPFIFKKDDTYILYYIGSPDGGVETRAIGYAWSKSLTDGWQRSDKALALPPDANNPAVVQAEDGSFLLYFRDNLCRMSVARASAFDGPYTVEKFNLFPRGAVEDMYVYKTADGYGMIAEDCNGVYTGLGKGGVHFSSRDGVNWDEDRASQTYDFNLEYTDGTSLLLQRRERPVLFRDGEKLYLISTAKCGGPDQWSGGRTWNMVQEIESIRDAF